jgi:Flp pilus assembly protein TadB
MPLAGERKPVHSLSMDTLAGRLDYLARNYFVFLGPLILLQGIGYATSPVLVWVSTALIALLLLNKIRMMRRSARAPR